MHKFYRDIEKQYDKKLGFESEIENLQLYVKKLREEENTLRKELFMRPLVGSALLRLMQNGIKEQDIIDIVELFKPNESIGTLIATKKDRQLLIDELGKYGGIKSVIKQLTQQVEELRKEVASLETQKQDLNTHSKKISSTLVYSKQSVDLSNLEALEHKVPSEFVQLIRAAREFPVGLPEFKASVMEALKEIIVARQNQQIK